MFVAVRTDKMLKIVKIVKDGGQKKSTHPETRAHSAWPQNRSRGGDRVSKKDKFEGCFANSVLGKWLNLLGWAWKSCDHTIAKNEWLGHFGHARVHDRAVAVSLDELVEPLVRIAPVQSDTFTFEVESGLLRPCIRNEVHDRVPEHLSLFEIHGQIHKVIKSLQTGCVEHFQQGSASHVFRELAKDQRCAVARITACLWFLGL